MAKKLLSVIIIIYLLFCTNPLKAEKLDVIERVKDEYGIKGEGVSIAILDTGISENVTGLNIKSKKDFTKSSSVIDLSGHGTFMYSLIGSDKYGIAPEADIFIGKVLERAGQGKYEDIIKGIEWAVNKEVDIILMSLGGREKSEKLKKAIEKAYNNDTILISAVGNDGISERDSIRYPAKFKQVIGVGAVDKNNQRLFNSSRGNKIDIMAPGHDLTGYSLNNETIRQSGTSVAAAYVAGFIALMKEYAGDRSAEEIKKSIIETAKTKGDKFNYGYGILQEEKAITYFDKDNHLLFYITIAFVMLVITTLTIKKYKTKKL